METPDAIFLGDFNGHSECWNSELSEDNRGAMLAEMFDSAGCVVLNGNEPTREQKGKFSSPDISIASASLAMSASWRCITALSSDHKPILVDIGVEEKFVKAEKRVFINFSKADGLASNNMLKRGLSGYRNPTTYMCVKRHCGNSS